MVLALFSTYLPILTMLYHIHHICTLLLHTTVAPYSRSATIPYHGLNISPWLPWLCSLPFSLSSVWWWEGRQTRHALPQGLASFLCSLLRMTRNDTSVTGHLFALYLRLSSPDTSDLLSYLLSLSPAETLAIMVRDCPPSHSLPFYQTFTQHIWNVFHSVCRDLAELRHLVWNWSRTQTHCTLEVGRGDIRT